MESKELEFYTVAQLRTDMAQNQIADFIISSIYRCLSESGKIHGDESLLKVADNILKPYGDELIGRVNSFVRSLSDNELYELLKMTYTNKNIRPFDTSSSVELCNLVLRLFGDLYGGPIVCDACVGRGDFLFAAIEYSIKKRFVFKNLIGFDINSQNVDVCNMMLACLSSLIKMENIAKAKVANSIQDDFWYPMTHCYVFPPLGLRFTMGEKNMRSKLYGDVEFSGKNTAEWIFIDNALSQNSAGKTIAITSPRALFNDDDKAFRDKLIENGKLEGIIELPQGTVGFTGISLIMLVFSSNNKIIKILDAKDCIIKQKKSLKNILDAEMVYDLYNASNCKSKTAAELISAKNLIPSSLNVAKIVIDNGVELGALAEISAGSQYTSRNFEDMFSDKPTGYKILTSSDIENGIVDWKKLQSIRYEGEKFDKFAVQYGDVIVTSKSSKIKTALVDIEPIEKILVTGGMLIIRPNRKKLNPVYLKMFLESKIGQASLKQIQKGVTIVTINAKDLSMMEIPLIDLALQDKKAEKYINRLSTIIGYRKEIERLEQQIVNAFDDEEE